MTAVETHASARRGAVFAVLDPSGTVHRALCCASACRDGFELSLLHPGRMHALVSVPTNDPRRGGYTAAEWSLRSGTCVWCGHHLRGGDASVEPRRVQ